MSQIGNQQLQLSRCQGGENPPAFGSLTHENPMEKWGVKGQAGM